MKYRFVKSQAWYQKRIEAQTKRLGKRDVSRFPRGVKTLDFGPWASYDVQAGGGADGARRGSSQARPNSARYQFPWPYLPPAPPLPFAFYGVVPWKD